LLVAPFAMLSAPAAAALPAATIVDDSAPFKAVGCDVQQKDGGALTISMTFENRDTLRTALQLEETVTLQDARGASAFSAIVPKGPYGPAGSATSASPPPSVIWSSPMPATFEWNSVRSISCTPYAALFNDGRVWLHFDTPVRPAADIGCAQLFARDRFAEAEARCVSSFNAAVPAVRMAQPAERHLADAETAAIAGLTAARAAARLGKLHDTMLLLEAIDTVANTRALEPAAAIVPSACRIKFLDFDACIRGEQQRAQKFYQAASRDQRRVFMLLAKAPDDYRGLPCSVQTDAPSGREAWYYCDRSTLRPLRGYLFVHGKLRSISNPQHADKTITS
jgi:hypothetical protein